ncbi:MAG: alpha-amylase, partial [Bacteroidia bacterium]|nr:alpha-amylase [Bacteroidia bacterium]
MKDSTLILLGLLVVGLSALAWACSGASNTKTEEATTPPDPTTPPVPEWAQNATIYEVNLRHYTEEGTFASFERELPRLKDMGIDILWFMPINPVSLK